MYKHITIYTLFLLLLIACGSSERGRMLAVLDEADSLNRNYIPFTTDSVLKEAAEWFDSHGSANERVRAHYLLGCAYRDMGEAPAALQSYHDAINCADTTSTDCDYRLLSRVHGQMGDIFIQEYLPTQALKEYNKASAYSLYEQDTIASLLFEEAKLQSYYMLNKEDSILSLTDKLRSQYIHLGCFKQAAGVVVEQLFIYARKKKLPELKEHLDFFSSQKDLNINTYQWSNYNYLYGMYYLGYNSLDSAEYFFRKQLMTANRDITKLVLAYFGLLELYKEKKIPDSLYKYSKLYSITNDSSNIHTESTIISRIQSQFNYNRHRFMVEQSKKKESEVEKILYSICLVFVIFVILSINLYKKKKRMHIRTIREINEKYYSEFIKYRDITVELHNIRQQNLTIRQLLDKKEEELNHIQHRLDKYKQYNTLSNDWDLYRSICDYPIINHLHSLAAKGKYADSREMQEFRLLVSSRMPNLIEKLASYDYQMNLRETNIILLMRFQFIASEISILLKISPQVLSNTKAKLLKKLFDINDRASVLDNKIMEL